MPGRNPILKPQLSELPHKKATHALLHLLLDPGTGLSILWPLCRSPREEFWKQPVCSPVRAFQKPQGC